MTESLNLAAAVADVLYGHSVPNGLSGLALLTGLGLAVAAARAWLRAEDP